MRGDSPVAVRYTCGPARGSGCLELGVRMGRTEVDVAGQQADGSSWRAWDAVQRASASGFQPS